MMNFTKNTPTANFFFKAIVLLVLFFQSININANYVYYNGNGSTSGSMNRQYVSGNRFTVKANEYARTGYWFNCWGTVPIATESYEFRCPGITGTITSGNSRTYYAQWAPNTYYVTFDANGGSGAMTAQGINYETWANLAGNAFYRTGYTFLGWATSPGGSVAYDNGAFYSMNTLYGVTLYAQWQVNNYNVYFNANYGSGSMSPQAITYGYGSYLSNNAYTRTGYSFAGWATSPGGSVVYSNTAIYEMNTPQDVTLYAQWVVNNYNVYFDANYGSGSMPAQVITYGNSSYLTNNAFMRTDYAFVGWATSPGGPVVYSNTDIYIMSNASDVRLYAQWTSIVLPTITSFTPSSGNPGTLVTITGTNLGSPTAFTIGGATAIVVSTTGTSLVGMVMPGATTGAISFSTAGGTATGSATFTVTATPYPTAQQGSKLVGVGVTGTPSQQGCSVSLSADGNTAIVGGRYDNNSAGAAWVYTRSGGTWSQQGNKLVGTGAVGAYQGSSVSLSADGNTAMVGGEGDNGNVGAAWVFTRTGNIWSQQGSKLVGTGAVGTSKQGSSVSLSADGNTAMVGGYNDNSSAGAAWVYTRSGSTWMQQGSKLVGTGATGGAWQGYSVSLSADGNTAMVGGRFDNNYVGAAWVFTRSYGSWAQQGSKLVGTGAVGIAFQGISVSLSADGNTAMVGGYGDNDNVGAAWVFTRSSSTWAQQGSKLLGTGASGAAYQGLSVSLSADGNTAMMGGFVDNNNAGAAWVFTRSNGNWAQQGSKQVGTGATGAALQGFSVALSADGNTAMMGGILDNNQTGAAWVFAATNTITYNGNTNTGGSVPAVTTGSNGASVTLASNSGSLTRTGYAFVGWNTAANGSGISYPAGASYTLAGNITLYAQWTFTSTPPGNALHFDGYDDTAITTTLDTDTSVVPVTTWEAWVYPTTNDAEYRMIMSIEDGGCDRFVAINSGNFVVGIGTVACLWAPVAIDLNKWQHIAVVYDEGAGIAKFYKNGVAYTSSLSGHSAAVKFGIGCSQQNGNGPAGATQFFQGAVDEVRVWEVARTQSEIQSTMYNELVGNESNLLAYYNFNQGIASESNYSVTTLTDVTGHGHDAPLSNFALSGATSNWVESYAMVVPTASAATSITDTSFTANWTAPVTGTYTHYVLDVATDPTFTYRVSGYDGLAVAGTSENVTGLPTGLTYYFRVRADKTSVIGQGAYSNVIAVAVGTPAVMSAPGNALYFDGTTDFVTVPGSASPFTGNADHTVEFNVLYKGGQTGDRWLLWYGTLAGDQIEVIGYNGETGLIKDHHVSAGNDITATTAALVPNKWTHVAMVYTGASRTMAIYINGAYVETFYYASDLAIPDYAPLQLGTFYSIADGVNFTCHMALDEVRIWDVARTESEIRATMYNELASNETNLKVYYNFNQGTASGTNTPITTLTDRTANGYHGTLNNFDLVGDTSNWVESYAMVVPTASAATSITSAGFTANWTAPAIGTVTNYLLDVATDPSFTTMVFGYDGLSVLGTSQAITGLGPGATYYYRVRADKTSVTGQGAYAAVQTVQLAVDYTITFVPPAGLAGMPNQTIAAGVTANLSANTMTYPGYTFAGWATTPGGAVVYSDGASYTMGATDVTLWSIWIAINPTGVISGNAEICAGTPTQLSIALTGTAPWSGTLSDGTPFSGSENPLLLSVTPTESTIYTIATLTSATATATVGDLSGSAPITALPSPAPVITGNLSFCVGGATTLSTGAGVQGIRQYASEVLDFSSEYTSDCGPWSSCQVLGEPNVYPDYGDRADNWSNESPNGGLEYLELGFSTPAPINYVDIYETYSPGSIYQVSLKNNTTGLYEVVYAVTAEPDSEEARMLHLTFPLTSYDVSAVRIDMDTALFGSFIQIDAVAIGAIDSNTYVWSTGETTSSIAVSTAGNYTVTATNTFGCSATSAISTVSVQSCISGNTAVCAETSAQLSIALTGQGPWSGTLSDGTPFSGSETPLLVTVTPTANTTYTIATLSNATSEDLGGSAMVTVNPLPTAVIEATTTNVATATITTNSSIALCEGGSVTLTAQAQSSSVAIATLNDVNGATLAVGLRKLKSDYSGPALRLRRSSDNNEQDFGFAGNNLDTAAISTWLNGTNGFCTTLYDQSGHGGDIRQSNTTAQPMYVESGINNKPILHFTTSQSLVNQVNYPAPFSVIYGSRVTGQSGRALSAQYNNWLLGYWGGYKDQAYFEGWITTPGNDSQSDTTYNIYAATGNGTASTIYKNGNSIISNGQGLEGPNGIGFNTGENSDFDFTDLMAFGTELSVQHIQKLNNSIGDYYGSGSVALKTYQWSTGATTPSIAVSTAGDYTVTVNNNYGCAATSTASKVTVGNCNDNPTGIISGNATVCAGTPTQLSIALTGQAPWSGTLSDGTGFSGSDNPLLVTVTPTETTTYTIATLSSETATASAADLSGSAVVTIVSVAVTISGAGSVCIGGTKTLTLAGAVGSIQWESSANNTDWTPIAGATTTTYNAPTTAAGTFYYRAVVPSGLCSAATTATATVIVNPLSMAGILSGPTNICINSTLGRTLTLSDYVGTIQWQSAATLTGTYANIAGATSATYDVVTTTAGTKYYRAVVTSGACSSSTSVAYGVTINPVPVVGTISGAGNVCIGGTKTLTLAGAIGTIQWESSANNTDWATIVGATASTYSVPTTTAGTFYYRAVVTSGLCSAPTTATVIVNPLSMTGILSGPTNICINSTLGRMLTLSDYVGTIQWQSSTTLTGTYANIAGATSATYDVVTTTAGTKYYRAVVTSGACSSSTSVAYGVTINPVSVAGTISGAGNVCIGGTKTLTLAGAVGSIQWESSANNTDWTPIISATATTYSVPTTTAGTFYYRAIVTSGACSAATTATATVIVNPVSVAGTISGPTNICINSTSGVTLTVSDYLGTTIQWQSSATLTGTYANIAGATSATYDVVTTTAGTKYYRAVVTSGACSASTSVAYGVTINPASVAGTISGAGNVCIGGTKTLTLAGAVGSIQWESSANNTDWTSIVGANSTTYNAPTTTAGTTYYRAVVTSGACNAATTATTTVVVNPLSIAGTISGPTNICINSTSGRTLTLANYTGTIQWQSAATLTGTYANIVGATSATYDVVTTTAGTKYYRAVVTSGACTASITVGFGVTINPVTVSGTISGAGNVCIGGTKTLTLTGAVGTIQWESSQSGISTEAVVSSSGGDDKNASGSISFTLGQVGDGYAKNNSYSISEGIQQTFNTQSTTNTNSSNWTPIAGATAATYSVPTTTVGTLYYHAVVNSGACSVATSATATVIVNPLSVPGTISGPTSICINATTNRTLTLSDYLGTIQWQSAATLTGAYTNIVGATAASYDVVTTTAGTKFYKAVVTSGACMASTTDPYGVTINPVTVSGTISGAGNVCIDGIKTLTLTGAVGSIQWESSANNTDWTPIAGATATTYSVPTTTAGTFNYHAVITSGACGTATTATATVIVNPVSVAGTISGPTSICINATTNRTLTLSDYVGTAIQWQTSATLAGAYVNIIGATAATYDVVTTTAGTKFYKAVVTSGACSSSTSVAYGVTINPVTVSGTISGAGNVCIGGVKTLTLAGFVGTIQWESSANNTDWTPIAGATATTYSVPTTTAGTYYYHAIVTSGVCSTATTATTTVIVNPITIVGTISGPTSICINATTNRTLTLSDYVGTAIQWQSSATLTGTYVNIIGATAATYDVVTTTAGTKFYKAVVTSGACSSSTSVAYGVTINPAPVAGAITGAGSFCVGGTKTLTLVGNTGTIAWQVSDSATGIFTTLDGENSTTYVAPTDNEGTYYCRALVTNTSCTPVATTPVAVIVKPTVVAGTILGPSNVCIGATAGNVLSLTNYTPGVDVKWQSATTLTGTYTNIAGATAATYSVLTSTAGTKYYKAVVTNGACVATTEAYEVTINSLSVAGPVSGQGHVCIDGSKMLVFDGAVGSIQWERSINGTDWTVENGKTNPYNVVDTTEDGTFYYHAIVTNGACGAATSPTGTIVVDPQPKAGNITGIHMICLNDYANNTLTLSNYAGNSIQWYESKKSNGTYIKLVGDTYRTKKVPVAIDQIRFYKTIVKSGACPGQKEDTFMVNITPKSVGGSISGGGYKCQNTGVGTLTLSASIGASKQWEKSTNQIDWIPIAGETSTTYKYNANLPGLTFYRVKVSAGSCDDVYSGQTSVFIKQNSASGGILGLDTININDTTTNTLTLSGYIGTAIKWQSATTLNGTYTNIVGATADTYTVPTTNVGTTYYNAVVTNDYCPASTSAGFKVTINPAPVTGTINAVKNTVCYNTGTILTVKGAVGTVLWYYSTNNLDWYSTGVTGTTYTTANLTTTTYYRVAVSSGVFDPVTSPIPTIIAVSPQSVATAVAGAGTVCNGSLLTLETGYVGTIQWQKATTLTGTYANIAGATSTPYALVNSGTAYYQAVVTSGVCAASKSVPVAVIVSPKPYAGIIDTTLNIPQVCIGGVKVLTLKAFSGSLQWQSSTDNDNWTTIAGATNDTYAIPTKVAGDYYFRVLASSGVCTNDVTEVKQVIVNPKAVAGSIKGNTTICINDSTNRTLSLSGYTGNIQWKSANTLTGTYESIVGATAASYNVPTNAFGTKFYRAIVSSGVCTTDMDTFTVNIVAPPVAGTISGGGSACISSVKKLTVTGAEGNIQWESSDNDGIDWNPIPGATATTYSVPTITVGTKIYRVRVSRGTCAAAVSDVPVVVTVIPLSVAGTIMGPHAIAINDTINNILTLSNYLGTAIQWQSASVLVGPYTAIAGATTDTYIVPTTTAGTKYYRVLVNNGVCGASTTAGFFGVTINPASVAGTINAVAKTICYNTETTLKVTGAVGTILWQYSTNNMDWFDTATIGATYTTGNLTTTTYYRVSVTSGVSAPVTTAIPMVITVSPETVATAVTGGGAICYGFTTGLTLTTGYIGTIKWQKSINNSTWTTITAATADSYTVPATTSVGPNYYRAVLTSGACSAVPTDSVLVNVAARSVAGTLSGAVTLCVGTNSAVLTLTGSRGAIQWQSASPLATSEYTNVSDATNSTTYRATNLTTTTYYKAIVQNEVCPALATAAVAVSIKPMPIATSITGGDETICPGIARTLVLQSGYTGSIKWQKSSSLVGTYTDIVGATAAIYQLGTAILANTTTYYRVLLTSGTCTVTTTPVFLTVLAAVNGGTVTGNEQVINNTSTTLTAAGYDQGALQWQKATVVISTTGTATITASSWSTVAGAGNTTAVFTTNSLTTPTAFRLAVTNDNGCKGYGEPIIVRILKNPTIVETHTSGLYLAACTSRTTTNTSILSISGLDLVPSEYTWQLLSSPNVSAATITTIGTNSTKSLTFSDSVTYYYYRVGIQYTNNPIILYSSVFNLQVGGCPSAGGGGKRITGSANKFDVLAYPNPFTNTFNLELITTSSENVQVNVYDAIGKLVETRNVPVSEVGSQEVGSNYPTGVYNITISQGTEMKTLRVIKK